MSNGNIIMNGSCYLTTPDKSGLRNDMLGCILLIPFKRCCCVAAGFIPRRARMGMTTRSTGPHGHEWSVLPNYTG
jgi:UPF0716 family protein affecting phage T7 exclusion